MTLLETKKDPVELGYEINVGHLVNQIIGVVGSIITIGLFFFLLEGWILISAVLLLLLVVLIIVLIRVFLRLRYVIRLHNKNVFELQEIVDNRNTLIKIVNEKNEEIKQLNQNIQTSEAQTALLFEFLKMESKPNATIIQEALQIENKEVDKND